ncbi:hypothetical protein B5S28_g1965 [[Candida] boidinii]|uniref:Unnamed protein product n=1 Tax=Candida boidinii TaxID=5477 RepID=A0ACB5THK1_CANBO|nr:hypothetical protein B5S28_g1965 [[Candida] boidinii]OWB64191.1 hypothetical protein B5S29_g5242 [[Candida] boidinii]OWB70767.1 hypothetical protein B5S31_g446 [[Candida] boidinii]GME80396.1 unnamed protein product [[Candida] boidinii]GME88902.1 unnamed protein product [[Candida] boidinii]
MKFLTTNFVRCAVKACDGNEKSYPLRFRECELELEESEFNKEFIISMLERLDWNGVLSVAKDLGNESLPNVKPVDIEDNEILLKDLHNLLIETQIINGKMVCDNCEHIYYIKDSIANFLLPPHLAN